MTNRQDDDEILRSAARRLQEHWDSPELWPAIEAGMRQAPARSRDWRPLAAAAALAVTVGGGGWFTWRMLQPDAAPSTTEQEQARLLSDEAYADVERAEDQYTRAIDELSALVAPKLEMPDSELLIALRERLTAIDAAIAESRTQIDRNPFNAQLRRQLLSIYQEKRRTLEQIQDHDDTTL